MTPREWATPGTLDLNAAAESQLTQLPRIGADKARKIVARRAVRRGFRDWADFAATSGITQADADAIRPRARIGPRPDGSSGRERGRRSRRIRNLAGSAASFRRRGRER